MAKEIALPEPSIVPIEITSPLPEICSAGTPYRIQGTVKLGIGTPPWVYAKVVKPTTGEVSYERGLPKPISGEFAVDLTFKDLGDYEVTVVTTPAPLPLPVLGVPPVVGKSGTMKVKVAAEGPPGVDIRVENLTIEPSEVQVGQPVTISVTATNYGTVAGSKTITCTVS